MMGVYPEELLDRCNYPQHRGRIEGAEVQKELQNSSCGDEIMVYLKMGDGVVTEAKWEGKGCAIAVVGAEILCEKIIGKSLEEFAKMRTRYFEAISGVGGTEFEMMEFVGRMPARQGCARLAWGILN